MPYNLGFHKENEMVFALDGRKISELGPKEKYLLREMYGPLDDSETVKCELIDGFDKPDFYIIYKGIRRNISLKTGRCSTIHEEGIDTFVDFLKQIGVSDATCNDFLFIFWRDGTIDGSNPSNRHKREDLIGKYKTVSSRFNESINSNKEIVKQIVQRIMFTGTDKQIIEADYLYFSELWHGVLVDKLQIFHHIDRKNWANIDYPHIGPLQFRPHALVAKNEDRIKYIKRVDFWWTNFFPDMEFIFKYYKRRKR